MEHTIGYETHRIGDVQVGRTFECVDSMAAKPVCTIISTRKPDFAANFVTVCFDYLLPIPNQHERSPVEWCTVFLAGNHR